MGRKIRILIHADERHLGGNHWYHSVNNLTATDPTRLMQTEVIGVAITQNNYPPQMARTRSQFEKNVDKVATDVRWFSNPLILSKGNQKI